MVVYMPAAPNEKDLISTIGGKRSVRTVTKAQKMKAGATQIDSYRGRLIARTNYLTNLV